MILLFLQYCNLFKKFKSLLFFHDSISDQKITKRYSFAEMALVPLVLGALALG